MTDNGTATQVSVQVNGETRRVEAGLTVRTFLESLDLHPELVVVEHNREILDRGRYEDVRVRDGDVLELVHFVGGG
ncbi:MAG TPA: sulfur carrier protein ThiS [Longimicrobiales bacterium]|nr:sulfur carrier protein ThiS [Longimicrobiales bacterium]